MLLVELNICQYLFKRDGQGNLTLQLLTLKLQPFYLFIHSSIYLFIPCSSLMLNILIYRMLIIMNQKIPDTQLPADAYKMQHHLNLFPCLSKRSVFLPFHINRGTTNAREKNLPSHQLNNSSERPRDGWKSAVSLRKRKTHWQLWSDP